MARIQDFLRRHADVLSGKYDVQGMSPEQAENIRLLRQVDEELRAKHLMAMNAERARRLQMQGAIPMPPPYKQSMSFNERELYEQLERMRGGGQDLRMDNSGQARDHGLLDHIDVEKHGVGEVVLFDESELKEGAAKTLRRVETPKVGQRFDTNKMLVDMVLVLNRMVAVIEEQAETIHDLGEQVRDLELRVYARKSEPKEEVGDFKLPSLAANYDDVEKP